MIVILAILIGAIGFSAVGWGLTILLILKLRCPERLERITVAAALGTAWLSFSVFALAASGLLHRPILVALVLVGVGLGGWRFRASSIRTRILPTTPTPQNLLIGVLFICVVANFIGGLAPISFIDALTYHVFEAREFLRAGRLIELKHTWQSYQPMSVEMLYTLALGLFDDRLVPLVDWALGVLALFSTLILGRRLGGPLVGLLAAAIFYCTAMVAWESTSCFIELGIAAGGAMSLLALLRWRDTDEWAWLVVAAIAAGFAAACKLTAAQMPLDLSLAILYLTRKAGRSFRRTLLSAAAFASIALVLVLPWYVRSYLLTGNPFYPFLPSIFGTNPSIADIQVILASYGVGKSTWDLLLSPWLLVSEGVRSENGQFLNPLPFLLGPVILWRTYRDRERLTILGFCVLWFIFWLKTAQVARYLVPIQPFATVLAADAAVFLATSSRLRRQLSITCCALFVAFSTATVILYDAQFLQVVLGIETREVYLTRTSWFYALYRDVDHELESHPRERAYVLTDEGPTYYLQAAHNRLRNTDFTRPSEELWAAIVAGHYTHVLIHNSPASDAALARLAPRLVRVWRKNYELPVSRSFGGTTPAFSTLWRVRPTADSPP
jgi:4-amino-4-deoxy-L-arabinose transferase-like glycosyltransferase